MNTRSLKNSLGQAGLLNLLKKAIDGSIPIQKCSAVSNGDCIVKSGEPCIAKIGEPFIRSD
jgi:hypothetical protein